jgi:hypothetical protein
VSDAHAAGLAAILGCPVSSFPQTYLGLPLSDRKLPALALEFLAAKIHKQIPSWRLSLVPIGGRLTLATAVLSALPLFAVPVLPLPKGILAKMDQTRRAMVWKAAAGCSGGDCQVAWDFVCHLREEGGLGMVDFALQNTCLLLKVLHGLLSRRDTPWTRWVRRNYLCSRPVPPHHRGVTSSPCCPCIGLLPAWLQAMVHRPPCGSTVGQCSVPLHPLCLPPSRIASPLMRLWRSPSEGLRAP